MSVSLERAASDSNEFVSSSSISASDVAPVSTSAVASVSVSVDVSISLEEPMPGRVRTDPGTAVPAL